MKGKTNKPAATAATVSMGTIVASIYNEFQDFVGGEIDIQTFAGEALETAGPVITGLIVFLWYSTAPNTCLLYTSPSPRDS